MFFKSSPIFRAIAFICAFAVLITSLPAECWAFGENWDFFSSVTSGSKEDEAAAQRSVKIDQLLEKAREMRFQGRFREARAYAQGALNLEKNNKLALSFLANLDVEEARYKAELDKEKKAKEEATRAKKEEASMKKEEAKQAKLTAAEAKKQEAAKKKAAVPGAQRQQAVISQAQPQAPQPSVALPSGEMTTLPSGEMTTLPSGGMTTLPAWRAEEIAKEKAASEALTSGESTTVPSAAGEENIPSALTGGEAFKMKPGQAIVVNGDKVEYAESGSISAEGNVVITYGDVTLSCDKIEIDTKSRQAMCEGNVRIEQPEGLLTGQRIMYDFIGKHGQMMSGEVRAYPWYGKAEETVRVSENEYLLKKGCVTTCDLDKPHYRLAAKEIKFYPDDKIIAKNVIMYVGKVPVMWIPYYYQPIVEYRAKVQLIPGKSTDWGYFLLTAWRYHIKGKTKVDFLLDYRTKKGFAEGANLYYHMDDFGLKGLGSGVFRCYFIEQNDWGTYDPKGFGDEGTKPTLRKRLQWNHRIDFSEDTVGLLEFNKMSDPNVLKDYFYNEFEDENRTSPSYVSVVSAKENYIFSFEADRTFESFDSMVQHLPEVKIDVPSQRLWDMPMYYTNQMSATSFEKKYAWYTLPPERVQRFDTVHRLTYVTGIGPVNLQPYGFIRETVYSRNRWESKVINRQTVGGGLNAFSQFHRIYDVDSKVAGMDINGLRHIIVPGALYFYQSQPNVDKDSLFQMDEIDTMQKENGIRFSLENKLQTKRHSMSDPTRLYRVDLVRFQVYTDYLFRLEKKGIEFKKPGKFDDPTFDLELNPYEWLFIQGKLSVTPKNQAVNTGSIEFSLRPGDRFRMDLGYRYEKKFPPDETRNQITFDTSYLLSRKWRLGLYERWDMEEGKIEEQQFKITRDLHCWEVELVYDVKGANLLKDEATLWFAFRIKAFPDLQIGLDRTYEKNAPGAMREDEADRYQKFAQPQNQP